jgi:hypothetical protein
VKVKVKAKAKAKVKAKVRSMQALDAGSCGPTTPTWWNEDYPLRHPLDVDAAPFEYTLELGATGADVSALYALNSDPDALRVLRYDGSWTELDREVGVFDASNLRVRFRIQESGGYAGGTGSYFLYAGASAPAAPLEDMRGVYLEYEDFEDVAVGEVPAGWRYDPATWQVVDDGGNHILRPPANGSRALAEFDQPYADFEISTRQRHTFNGQSNGLGYFIRGTQNQPISSLYWFNVLFSFSGQTAAIADYVVNYNTAATGNITISDGVWYSTRTVVVGSRADVYKDGVFVVTRDPIDANVMMGIYSYQSDGWFDDVRMRRYQAPEPVGTLAPAEYVCP